MKNRRLFLPVLISTIVLLILTFSLNIFAKDEMTKDITLSKQLNDLAEASKSKTPPEKKKIMSEAIEKLRIAHVAEKALKVGDKMPSFNLPDVKKGLVKSSELLKKGPIVVVFYRGGWCPYCNLQLRDLQKNLSEITKTGAQLIAISPQTPDSSLSTAQKSELSFFVLSDVDNQVAKMFNLVYKLPDNLKKVYKEFGIDLDKSNGSNHWELPVSATYIVTSDGQVAYAFVDVDYKKRAETTDIIKKLKTLSNKKKM